MLVKIIKLKYNAISLNKDQVEMQLGSLKKFVREIIDRPLKLWASYLMD
jgi:hypothetical protein